MNISMSRTLRPNSTPSASPAESSRTLPLVIVLSTLLFAALCAAGYFYYQYQKSPQVADAKEIVALKKTVGDFFMLPEGEEPTLATVTDKEKLVDQPFFSRAENGDKVLIYSNAGRAVLYRPSTHKIVDVTSVNVSPSIKEAEQNAPATESAVPASLEEDAAVTITLYNGSTKSGITTMVEQKIVATFPQATIAKKEAASQNTYKKTIVVDPNGQHTDLARRLAELLGGSVAAKPDAEVDAGTDLLVIVGSDQIQ